MLNQGILKSKTDADALAQTIYKVFDLNRIAIISVGRQRWQSWNDKERKAYRKVFIAYMLAIYQHRFHNYHGMGLEIYKVQAKKKRALVYTKIKLDVDEHTLQKDKKLNIDFILFNHKKKGKDHWLISDVYFKGTISEVAGYRAQFSKILEEKGREGLIAEMRKKCKVLGRYCNE